MVIKMILIITLMALAVIDDLYEYKVRNEITFTFAAIGVIYTLGFCTMQDFYSSIFGLAIPFFILLPLYISKMLGAGDIKLICALGAFIGLRLIVISIVYSFLVGAVIAIIIMFTRKNILQRFKYFFAYVKCCLLCMSIIPYCDINVKQDGTKMHFAIPIALGTTLVLIM